jgi:hypothetical protein
LAFGRIAAVQQGDAAHPKKNGEGNRADCHASPPVWIFVVVRRVRSSDHSEGHCIPNPSDTSSQSPAEKLWPLGRFPAQNALPGIRVGRSWRPPRLLGIRKVAAILDVSTPTVRRLVRAGILPPPKKLIGEIQKWSERQILGFLYAWENGLLPPIDGRARVPTPSRAAHGTDN